VLPQRPPSIEARVISAYATKSTCRECSIARKLLAREARRREADVIGGIPNEEQDSPGQLRHLEALLDIAEEFDTPLDTHVDHDADPSQKALEMLADLTLQRGLRGRPRQPLLRARHLSRARERACDREGAGVPASRSASRRSRTSNRLDRSVPSRFIVEARAPRKLLDAGVNVAAGTDNMNDVFSRHETARWRHCPGVAVASSDPGQGLLWENAGG
jgi:cytosine deaminase